MSLKKKKTRVLVALILTNFGYEIAYGISKYVQRCLPADWEFSLVDASQLKSEAQYILPKVSGIIGHISDPEVLKPYLRKKIPFVNVSNYCLNLPVAYVASDDEAVGRMGADYLLGCGFRLFAYYGFENHGYSSLREKGFVECLKRRGFAVASFSSGSTSPLKLISTLNRWHAVEQRPIALMCCNDSCARRIINARQQKKMIIPEQLSVLGVDNNLMDSSFCAIPISSIRLATEMIGYRAIEVLAGFLHGKIYQPHRVLIPPLEVVTRRSTELIAVDDPALRKAISFIRSRVEEGVTVEDVIRHVWVSRRILERKFESIIGSSPHTEIINSRIYRAKDLLVNTDLPISTIAEKSGFKELRFLSRTFHLKTGLTPSRYRIKYGKFGNDMK